MKYMISWFERPQGSPADYENAQKRILEVFGQWKAPAEFQDRVVRGASRRLGWVPASWTATIRWPFTSSVRRSRLSNSRRDP